MKMRALIYKSVIASMLLLALTGVPGASTAWAQPEGPDAPEAPDAPDAATASISKPIVVFRGLDRDELGVADPDVIPPAPYYYNDLHVIGAVPDTTGAVGYTHYMQAVNEELAIFMKSGELIDHVTFNDFWATATTNTVCDGVDGDAHHGQPYIIYDHKYARWLVADVAYDPLLIDNGPYYICIAVSTTIPVPPPPYPLGYGDYLSNNLAINWYYYAIPVQAPGTPHYYPDSIKIGMWGNGYYMSVDALDLENHGLWRNPTGAIVWALNRDKMTGGTFNHQLDSFPVHIFEGTGYESLVPTNLLGDPPSPSTPNYFASIQPGRMHIWEFHVNWVLNTYTFGVGPRHDPNYTINTDTASIWAGGNLVPQPSTDEQVDAMGHRLTSPLQYRRVFSRDGLGGIPSLWTSHTIYDGTRTGIRWYELQFAQDGTPYVYQKGTHMPNNANCGGSTCTNYHTYRWLPSLAVDRAGNMAIGFNRDNDVWPPSFLQTTEFPSIFYTGRLRSDIPGTLPQGEYLLDLANPFRPPWPFDGVQYDIDPYPDGPWGRNSQMTVDPNDNCTFWFTSMHYWNNDGLPDPPFGDGWTWTTRVGAFSFPECRAGQLKRISLHTNNTEGNDASGLNFDPEPQMYAVATSKDGRYVVFPSDATDLIDNDNNTYRDIFLRDRDTDGDTIYDEPGAVKTIRLPINTFDGQPPNFDSFEVSMSYDGRYVAFSSGASNLVANDTNTAMDIFLFDRDADNDGIFDEPGLGDTSTQRVSVSTSGVQALGTSLNPFISGNGRFIAFSSNAFNLDTIPPDLNGAFDIFIRDRDTDADGIYDEPGFVSTQRVSLSSVSAGPVVEGDLDSIQPTLSNDGHFLAFSTYATTLAPVNIADFNGFQDVYLIDLWTGDNVVMSVANTSLTIGNNRSYTPYISGDGMYVVYASLATNLEVPAIPPDNGYADIYLATNPLFTGVLDPTQPIVTPISRNFAGVYGNGNSYSPSINEDGTQIAFASDASNLDPFLPDLNRRRDVFLYDMSLAIGGLGTFGSVQRISVDAVMGEPNDNSYVPVVAPGGRHVIFVSEASDLVSNDFNFRHDVFAYDGLYFLPVFLQVIGNSVPVDLGGQVDVTIRFTAEDYQIDAMAFSIDYDELCLDYASHAFAVPPNFFAGLSYNPGDTDGELDINLYSWPRTAMPDGTDFLTITFDVLPTCNAWDGSLNAAHVYFSRAPRPSFGSWGQSIRGAVIDGFVLVGEGTPGDCNGNGSVEAGDFEAVVLEIFDGDGNLPADTPGGTFAGNPVGCNPNADAIVDAADIACTVDIFFNGSAAACLGPTTHAPLTSAPVELVDTPVMLTIPDAVPVSAGVKAFMPVTLNSGSNPVNSLVFSIDIDQTWLVFDPTDGNGDGVPDSITWNVPGIFLKGLSYDPTDTDGELDVVVYSMNTLATLPDGTLMVVALDTNVPSSPLYANVVSSSDPQASFGSTGGQSLPGILDGGSVWLLLTRIFYMPFIHQ